MEKALISVIVPIYMVEDYLPTCIESICGQSYTNLEIILVDDGSKDKCGEICEEKAKSDKRINVIHKENGGLSDARNAGIEFAHGDYIVFIDSDDKIHPRMIELLMKPIETSEADMSVCDYKKISENERVDNIEIDDFKFDLICTYEERTEEFYSDNHITFDVVWNKIYPKEYFDDIRFPKGRIHEDEFVTYRLLEKADRIAYVRAPLYYYLIRESSIMGNGFKIGHLDRFIAYDERISGYIEKKNYLWAAKILRMYRIMIALEENEIMNSKQYDDSVLKKYINNYQKYVVSCFFKMPVSFKERLIFMLSSLCPHLYLKMKT